MAIKKKVKKKTAPIKKFIKRKIKKKKINRNPKGIGGFGDHPESINRRGAPPKEKTLTFQLRKLLDEFNTEGVYVDTRGRFVFEATTEEGVANKRLEVTNKEIVVRAMFRAAMKGNTGMMQQLYDRIEGRVPQEVHMLGNDLDDLSMEELERREKELKSRISKTTNS